MNIRPPYIFFGMLGILLLGMAVVFSTASRVRQPLEEMPTLGAVLPFELTNSRGEPFASSHLDGKVWVADFIFTTCAGPCPLMSQKMARLQRTFRRVPGMALVSFTVDPETDTPEVLAEYGRLFGANPDKWHFLTGEYEAIQKIAVKSFALGSVEQPIHHSTYFTLVDRHGNIRGYFDSNDYSSMESLITDIQRLLAAT